MSKNPQGLPISVLIVEDVEEMAEWLKVILGQKAEFQASVSLNLAEARRAVRRKTPQFVLLDEVLPGESALDAIDYWKGEPFKIILISGLSSAKEVEGRPLPPGVLGRVQKPLAPKSAEEGRFYSQVQKLILDHL